MLRLIASVRRLSRRKARLLSGFVAMITATAIVAFPGTANAEVLYSGIYRNWANGGCLDSNYAGEAYMLGCNFGRYQQWRIDHIDNKGWVYGYNVINVETGLCLDSNSVGRVYTLKCNGGDNQIWWMYGYDNIRQGWMNKKTGRMLSSKGGLTAVLFATSPLYMDDKIGAVWRPGF